MTTYEQERTAVQVEVDEDVLDRVKKGLAWLEKTHGPGWEDKIDLETLRLSSTAACVLGQVYSGYSVEQDAGYLYATNELLETPEGVEDTDLWEEVEMEKMGFCAEDSEWDLLDMAWRQVLEPRIT